MNEKIQYCRETRRRIRVALWAYAYEVENTSLVSDAQYDEESRKIDRNFKTGNLEMDSFFLFFFEPHTGAWVHLHPGIKRLKQLYDSLSEKKHG